MTDEERKLLISTVINLGVVIDVLTDEPAVPAKDLIKRMKKDIKIAMKMANEL